MSGTETKKPPQKTAEDSTSETGQSRESQRKRIRERYFRALIENSLDAIAVLNSDLTFRYLSPSTERVIGYKPEELVGKNPLDYLPSIDSHYVMNELSPVTKNTGDPVPIEVRFLHKNGSLVVVEGVVNDLSNDPIINGIVVNYRNITERIRTQDKLRVSEEHFRALIENSRDGIAILNNDLTFRYVSPSVEWIMGYKPDDLIGKNALDFLHTDDAHHITDNREVSAGDAMRLPMDVRFLHRNGYWCILEAVTNDLRTDPTINGIIVNIRDISERKRAEEARVEILTLQSMALQAQGDLDQAVAALERALSLAEPEGHMRIFLDEGKPMLQLLSHAASRNIAPNYASKLLEMIQGRGKQAAGQPQQPGSEDLSQLGRLPQPPAVPDLLTERELEVLRLIASGASNYEISQTFTISLGTVKKHISNIYSKLDVCKRTLAISKAQELGLI